MQRRSFLKMAGAAVAGMSLPFKFGQGEAQVSADVLTKGKFWIKPGTEQEYFRHRSVNTNFVDENIIWAKVDGLWQKYEMAEFNDEFHDWWIRDTFDRFDRMFSEQPIPNGGKHTPGIATYSRRGVGRGDSNFHINNAFKSVTIVPKVEYLDEYIGVYEQYLKDGTGPYSLEWKQERLKDKSYWDRRILCSTDLYSGQRDQVNPGELDVEKTFGFKESHYLLNTMVNPVANILYLDTWTRNAAPTWEVRCIAVNTHWNNPDDDEMSERYQKYRKCVMLPHQAQHGGSANHIGIVFHIVEMFDNRDSSQPPGRGVKIVPPGFQYLSHAEYLAKKMMGRV